MEAKKLKVEDIGLAAESRVEALDEAANFYREMKSFSVFEECIVKTNYHEVPEEWIVLVADVKGSTLAIRQGRYQDVNLAGASAISAVMNTAKGFDLPYQFGGDGATILIPAQLLPILKKEMARLKAFINQQFDLDLRIGFVTVSELHAEGNSIKVARYEMSPGNCLAMFDGTGVRTAEDWVKENSRQNYQIQAAPEEDPPNLQGLSCRWQPLKSQSGITATLLISPTDKKTSDKVLRPILEGLNEIAGGTLDSARPTKSKALKTRWWPKNLSFESSGHQQTGEGNPLWIVFQTIVVKFSVMFGFKIRDFDPKVYLKEIEVNTDYRKFDNMLRLILDCTPAQAGAIQRLLYEHQDRGTIDFGMHSSESALMTCIVFSLEEGKHIHFVDGADGGYAMAAVLLKDQMNKRSQMKVSL